MRTSEASREDERRVAEGGEGSRLGGEGEGRDGVGGGETGGEVPLKRDQAPRVDHDEMGASGVGSQGGGERGGVGEADDAGVG